MICSNARMPLGAGEDVNADLKLIQKLA